MTAYRSGAMKSKLASFTDDKGVSYDGAEAFRCGWRPTANPYKNGTSQRARWLRDWHRENDKTSDIVNQGND